MFDINKTANNTNNLQHYLQMELFLLILYALSFKFADATWCKDRNGKWRYNNENWRDGYYMKRCYAGGGRWQIKITSCLTRLGQNVEIGSSLNEGDTLFTCTRTSSNTVQIWYKIAACTDKCGRIRAPDEEWQENEYMKKCFIEGFTTAKATITACVTETGQRIEIGQSATIGRETYTCNIQNA